MTERRPVEFDAAVRVPDGRELVLESRVLVPINRRRFFQSIAALTIAGAARKSGAVGILSIGGGRPVSSTPTPPTDWLAWRAPLGTDLFIDAGAGSDGSGTFASPWKTISSARYASIAPSQCLWVRNTNGSVLTWVDCTNAQSGTAIPGSGSQVVVSGYPGDPIPTIAFTDSLQRVGGSVDTRGWYHWWRKLDIQCTNWGILLANVYGLSGDSLSKYFTISDCTGHRSQQEQDNSAIVSAYGNNSKGLSDRAVAPVTVARCSFTSVSGGSRANSSLVFLEYQSWMQILGNLLVGSYNPLYFKHNFIGGNVSTQYALVKNNIMRNAEREVGLAADFVDYINNAFFNSYVNPSESGGDPGGNNCNFFHNTFYGSDCVFDITDGGAALRQNNVGRNNVWLSTSCRWQDNPSGGNGNFNQNNNVDYSAADAGNHWYRNSTQYTKALYNGAFGQEANGVQGTCSLVGGTTPGDTPANWALFAGSVGIGTASDGGDRGVNAANLLTVN